MNAREETLRRLAREHGQGHLFDQLEALSPGRRAGFLEQVEHLDFGLIGELRGKLTGAADAAADASPTAFEPPEIFPLTRSRDAERRAREARLRGEELLEGGRVGYLLVAGGQASRLGSEIPKGCYPVGPVSGRSLFEWHARRLLAAQRRYGCPTPFYVMTSAVNRAATVAFFEEHAHFGLDPGDVRFFEQGMLPALDLEGRILLKRPGELFLAPNGHGGVLAAFRDSGCLADARARSLETLSYFQVDNPLARPADPFFLGLHHGAGADMSSKVVPKRDADEKVGVLGLVDGRLGCIEYSDLPEDLRHARDASGELLFGAGNIAVHALSVDFFDRITAQGVRLPWHVARKTMRVLGEHGGEVERDGVKFETFVFDALGLAERSVTVEVDRTLEFSPLKNAAGPDSPETVRRDLVALFAEWVRAAGLALPPADAEGLHPLEVDPLLAESAEEFRSLAPRTPPRAANGHLYEAPSP